VSTLQTLAAVGELRRDLQRELTYDGLWAAEAKGNKGGRRPAVAADKTSAVRTAYLEARSITALARDGTPGTSAVPAPSWPAASTRRPSPRPGSG
jgi:DNA invertase Pin-like site-specific DNA recombinase